MSKNPYLNAITAAAYIFFVVFGMNAITQPLRDKPDTFLAPVTVLFVLTLSVAVMAYVFFYQPVVMLIEGHKKQAVSLFTRTVGVFAALTAVVLLALSLGVL